ncbi:hypothetical protein OHT76_00340 [Streptomyces sp. NBC_00287]|uniref:hypothetical protein n=1 Tax=Streptomyces sp. NBC_00287 TaxID=2975702 RepID=UPI002E2A51CB|nr:hypothetical protein [Streptomyces sp. NBC_00287]
MSAEVAFAAFTAVVAIASVAVAWMTVRAGNMQTGFELARALYERLTSADVTMARKHLETYRLGPHPTQEATRAVVEHYYILLWAFEQVFVGRESLLRRRRANGTKPALTYLDDSIRWHVAHWVTVWPELRLRIVENFGLAFDDYDSVQGLCNLADRVLGPTAAVADVRRQIEHELATTGHWPHLPNARSE